MTGFAEPETNLILMNRPQTIDFYLNQQKISFLLCTLFCCVGRFGRAEFGYGVLEQSTCMYNGASHTCNIHVMIPSLTYAHM
jgi:hypothetical protein